MPNCFIVHYDEIGLKGNNRAFFENRLRTNILRACKQAGVRQVKLMRGRIIVMPEPAADYAAISALLRNVFGIAYFAPAFRVEQEIESIAGRALTVCAQHAFETFRIRARRSQKAFPYNSMQVNMLVGKRVEEAIRGARVDLKAPDLTIHIEIYDNEALVYGGRIDGAGGLPVGVSDRAVALLSSGIDSPVAAYKIMRRGVRMIFVHFHSVPYTSPASLENAEHLVRQLTVYQLRSKLYFVPFLDIQQEITGAVQARYRVILYRRMMLRIAERIARKNRAYALVTGDSIAQVASQTMPNLAVINQVATLPVIRPLAGEDKKQIIKAATEIGTFETSIQPYDDCCSLFVPANPETRAKLPDILELETKLDVPSLVDRAVRAAELKQITIA